MGRLQGVMSGVWQQKLFKAGQRAGGGGGVI